MAASVEHKQVAATESKVVVITAIIFVELGVEPTIFVTAIIIVECLVATVAIVRAITGAKPGLWFAVVFVAACCWMNLSLLAAIVMGAIERSITAFEPITKLTLPIIAVTIATIVVVPKLIALIIAAIAKQAVPTDSITVAATEPVAITKPTIQCISCWQMC